MMEKTIAGKCSPKFALVEQAFRRNFTEGWEREGAALAVYWKGQLVVDLHGGYADKASLRRWDEETRTVLFSVTKGVAALAIQLLVERKCIAYADAVCTHWPEFGQNGKDKITLEDVLLHRGGLAAFDETVTLEDARNPERMARIIEAQKPNWTPGTKSGYHAVTFGWLIDQIVRRVDPQKRGIAQFVREEITDKHGIDFHLGLPFHLSHTVSRLTLPSAWYRIRELVHDPRVFIVLGIIHMRSKNSIRTRIHDNPPWIRVEGTTCTFNNPEIFCGIEQVAALGISRARDVGKIFALMQSGQIISKESVAKLARPQIANQLDYVLKVPVSKGYGFMYEPHPRKRGKWLYGHPGFGGTTVMMDPEEELVIAYVANGLKTGMGELTRTYRRLRDAALDSVMAIDRGTKNT